MTAGLLLFALVDAIHEDILRLGRVLHDDSIECPTCDEHRARLGQWRALWWGTR